MFITFITFLLIASTITSAPSAPSVVECLTSYDVPFQTSTSSNWSSLILPYNLRLSWEPSIVTLPYTPSHVSDSVKCAAAAGLKVQAKSGGHSYASFSTGGRNGSVIVNLQNFHSIEVDNDGIATVGGGVRLGNLARGVYAKGERALPHGVCPGVGIGGHFTHGGYGYQARHWGLALDSIVALDVVLANGTYIHATATQHPSIFFAMRGAADSFGIVTYFHLQTRPAPSSIVTFTADIPEVYKDPSALADSFMQLQSTGLDPTYLTSNVSFSIYANSKGTFTLRGWCIECDLVKVNDTLFPRLLEGFPSPSKRSVVKQGWINSITRLAEGVPLEVPLYNYDIHENFAGKSIVTKNSEPLTRAQWEGYWTFVVRALKSAPTPWYAIIDMYGGAGSQINVPSSDSSAFSHRDSLWVIQNNAYTPNNEIFPDNARIFVKDFTNSITDGRTNNFGIYLNCVDPDLSPEEVANRGYGHSTYNKLLSIKHEVDPDFVFWNPQAIGMAGPFPERGPVEEQKLELRS